MAVETLRPFIPPPPRDLFFSIGGGNSASLDCVQAQDGSLLLASLLQKMPPGYLEKLLSAASAVFSPKDVSAVFTATDPDKPKYFSLYNGVSQVGGAPIIGPGKDQAYFLKQVKKIEHYAETCGLKPHSKAPEDPLLLQDFAKELESVFAKLDLSNALYSEKIKAIVDKLSTTFAALPVVIKALASILTRIAKVAPLEAAWQFLQVLNYPLGGLYAASALFYLRKAYRDYSYAISIGDHVGARCAILQGMDATTLGVGSGIWIASLKLQDIGATALSGVLHGAAWWCWGAGSVLQIGYASYHIYKSATLYRKIDDFMENPHLQTHQKIEGALHLLHDQVRLTEKDLAKVKIRLAKKHPALSPAEFKTKLDVEIEKRVKKKLVNFIRKVGRGDAEKVHSKVKGLLERLENPATKQAALQEGLELIQEVRKGTIKIILFHAAMAIVAFIFLAACLFINISTMGALPAIIGLIFLLLYMAKWIKKYVALKEMPALQPTS